MRRPRDVIASERGQMAVELVVAMPVVVVVALVVYNLGCFLVLCARFDRVAPDAIISQGVSPAGEQTSMSAVGQVQACIWEAMDRPRGCEVEVVAQDVNGPVGALLGLHVGLRAYRCTLSYRPWPANLSVAGVDARVPLALRHEHTLVVDAYKPGVIV